MKQAISKVAPLAMMLVTALTCSPSRQGYDAVRGDVRCASLVATPLSLEQQAFSARDSAPLCGALGLIRDSLATIYGSTPWAIQWTSTSAPLLSEDWAKDTLPFTFSDSAVSYYHFVFRRQQLEVNAYVDARSFALIGLSDQQ